MEEKILEIIDRNSDKDGYVYDNAAKEITSLMMEFIEWLAFKSHGNFSPRFDLHKYWDGTVNEWKATFRKFTGLTWEDIPIEELFDYWLTNIKNK